ncbi:MAG: diguanylate cyclase [Deltaproteobacteria bacterium]|jgi:diguanylate cyclase|nr:diguanylate cyclase [Deltaproteobacteria bacterium]
MVETKQDLPSGACKADPERLRELELEICRLEGERDDFLRAFKPFLLLAAGALARERKDCAGNAGGNTEHEETLSREVQELSRALGCGKATAPQMVGIANRLASHFMVREEPSAHAEAGAYPVAAVPVWSPAGPPVASVGAPEGGDAAACESPEGVDAAFRSEIFAELMNQAAALHGGRYLGDVVRIRAALRAGGALRGLLDGLSGLLLKILDDFQGERRSISDRLSTIIRTLISLEHDFRSFLDRGIGYFGESEADFTDGIAQRVGRVQDSLSAGPDGDPEHLLRLIAEEMEINSNAIRQKAAEDKSRLSLLQEEKSALETSLDSVRRDYDSFVQQSRQMLKEIEEMRSIALRDGLTKVFNRRAYDEQLLLTLLNFKSGKLGTFSFVIFDIDHFREVNNVYGHQAGDRILAHIAGTVTSTVRSDDFVFRYGGDEFVVILPGAALQDGMMVADKIRRAIENVEFVLARGREESLRVTVSMGVAEALQGDTPGSILSRADKALYASKQAGRNRVTAASAEL